MWSLRILAIVALATIALGMVGYAFATPSGIANVVLRAASRLGLAHRGIQGNATIWYWAVNCPATTGDIGISLNVTSANGRTVQYPLNWSFRPGCVHTATFRIELHPGRYTVTLSTPMSCTSHRTEPSEESHATSPSKLSSHQESTHQYTST